MTTDTTAALDEPVCHVVTIEPERPNGRTIVMTHGAWHTGEHYTRTFDGRPGWAHDFAAAGYRVLLADYPGTGRSPAVGDPSRITGEFICAGLGRVLESVGGPVDLLVHSMSGPYGFRLLETHGELIGHLVAVAPALPPQLAERPDDWEDLGSEYRTVYGGVSWTFPKVGWTQGSRDFVVGRCIGASTRFPTVDPDVYLATLSPLWAGLSVERLHEVLDPPRLLPDYAGGRVLVIIGTNDTGHPRAVDAGLVDWLNERGARADFCYLGDRGIEGNGHMLMCEENSTQIAGVIMDWLAD